MLTVFANFRSICHAGSGNVHTCAIPDVCKTPSPGGPIPIPYPNIAKDGDLSQGSKKTKIGGNPIALESSKLAMSSGDEAGTVGGLMSSKFKGAMKWASVSLDVKVEGKGVARLGDVTQHNGNTFNSAFISAGSTGLAYGDDTVCAECGKDQESHAVLESFEVQGLAQEIIWKLDDLLDAQRPTLDRILELVREWGMEKDRAKTTITNAKKLRQKYEALATEYKPQIQSLNAQLKAGHVLRMEERVGTYVGGYMLGALVCKCGTVKVAACSGQATPGFKKAAEGFTLKEAFTPTENQKNHKAFKGRKGGKWDCAAPKLLEGAGDHDIGTIVEKWYSPYEGRTVSVTYNETVVIDDARGEREVTRRVSRDYESGATVPSCETCQQLLPMALCPEKRKPCPNA